eukprot:GHUV01040019.1.p1 GENE.GHUV01040019.1~~GHUV01040019.1.p1  ORF type:complete len:206 (-),score=33.03 GHUV01040019.1:275-892(-)
MFRWVGCIGFCWDFRICQAAFCCRTSAPTASYSQWPSLPVHDFAADYIINNMNMPLELAQQLVQELYYKYGTTMAGLAATGHNLDFDHWHDHVHGTLDYDRLLHKQPAHHKVLENLNVQRHVFTNADAKHAANCLTRMGLTDCFQVGTRMLPCSSDSKVSPAAGGWCSLPCQLLQSAVCAMLACCTEPCRASVVACSNAFPSAGV